MLMVGFFEDLPSERAIAARCADSIAIRQFLHYELAEATPDHSSLSVIRQRLDGPIYEAVFTLVLAALPAHGLLRGRNVEIDSSVMEAHASLRGLVNRNTGEAYWEYVKRLTDVEGLSPLSRRHYLSKASQFSRWCLANKRCIENPVAVVKRPKVIPDDIEFYSVAQCKRLLELASEYGLYHYVVLGMFPGIRPTELRRVDHDHIKLDRRMVTLAANVTKKTRRRFVEMPVGDPFGDCIFTWLSAQPLVGSVFKGSHSTFVRQFREIGDALGFKWIQDGLRHTAATYHFVMYGDAAKTAGLLGERDIRTLLEHYKGLATKADAEAFYALWPSNSTAMIRRLITSSETTATS